MIITILGSLIQIFSISTTISLIRNMSPPKRSSWLLLVSLILLVLVLFVSQLVEDQLCAFSPLVMDFVFVLSFFFLSFSFWESNFLIVKKDYDSISTSGVITWIYYWLTHTADSIYELAKGYWLLALKTSSSITRAFSGTPTNSKFGVLAV